LSIISASCRPIFPIFTPYENALGAYDKCGPYFPIWYGTLPWQLNDVAALKVNSYYMHSLHVRQMAGRFCFTITCNNITQYCGTEWAICSALPHISSFFLFTMFLMTSWRQIISASAGLIFAIFSPIERNRFLQLQYFLVCLTICYQLTLIACIVIILCGTHAIWSIFTARRYSNAVHAVFVYLSVRLSVCVCL